MVVDKNNQPTSAPQEQPNNPIDLALGEFRDKKLSRAEIVGQLEGLKQHLQNNEKSLLKTDRIPELRPAVFAEVEESENANTLPDAEKNVFLADLETRLAVIEQLAQQSQPTAEPSLFSKEGMKKAFEGGTKNIGATLTALDAILDQFKEQIAVSIGGSLDMLQSVMGESGKKMIPMLRLFIGEDRIHLSKTLNAAKITLPMAAFIHARKSIVAVRNETAANVQGWTAERMSFVLVKNLTLAKVTGTEDAGVLEQKITDASERLKEEIGKNPGNGVNFAEAGKQPELRLSPQLIADKEVSILSDGSMTVGGVKWRLKKDSQDLSIVRAEFVGNILTIVHGTSYSTTTYKENLNAVIQDLASADATKNNLKPDPEKGDRIEFIRVTT